ncbi:MAG: DNA polymerase III subunit alpha [Syntrophaceticus schinkii]|jgi:DNA polymerase-3 subunit alpha|uniref:DNA polymerase III subunit alpha n=2 Tax=Syntrophaceticus schinkii TaxID=499207 RepID=A0A0B7MI95_9FIRM|nr:DNA polymerase III subunit alpha [Syntrophaceticus schinkii]MDD4260783.1 DNA polymerase III subunit alpha [Syntrophaceticus schinkii]MDD4674453.1 DNA polymerase III subunit alpha [Syntrophaceticus schinkii]CEO89750.1 DNA polymerase III subunit alpha [Syntrophaceticus schinkii]
MTADFVHLHVHSEYSLLDGASRLQNLVQMAVEYEMPSIALTDHGVMYGVIDFYKLAKKAGINPVLGCEVYMAPRTRFDKEAHIDDTLNHLVLLAENEQGYKNLLSIVSNAYLDGFYYKPRADRELLAQNNKGIIALSACMAGEIPRLILDGDYEKARNVACEYREIFGRDNYFLEMMDHHLPEQRMVNEALRKLSQETGIPLVVTNDAHYLRREDARIHDVLLCIQTGKTLQDENRLRFTGQEFYLKSPQEMASLFPNDLDALRRTREIADRCHVEFDFSEMHLPEFQVPAEYDLDSYLRKLCEEGISKRYPDGVSQEAKERLAYELRVIQHMGFSGYFLIVQDFVNWARTREVPVGPGRGSAAGSLVAYSLGITNIDPLKYGLLFERFLNPDRVSMPDIDIDFCYERREEVIDYVISKYGDDHVAQIITFGTMMARAAIRDVGRVLNLPLSEVDRIAKLVPEELGVTLEKAVQTPELKQLYDSDPEVKQLLDLAQGIEGMPRHASTHAAGIVISSEPLVNFLPLQKNGGALITQFPKETVEEIGLLKMDFLGLRTLTVIGDALQTIESQYQERLDPDHFPLDDKQTYELLSSGETSGVFQLESTGMRHILKNMKPQRFEDLIALVALYRPGPLGSGMVDDFISRKNGETRVEYPHPALEAILKETYGVILYQEQVMQISCDLAGFSMAEADSLRRAMGKKKPEVLSAMKENFLNGSREHDVDSRKAAEIFELMEHFAGYGFNKSHSAAYAFIAYQTAYLKAHYPVAFMAAMLTSFRNNSDKVSYYIQECRRLKIEILPPDVNESLENFTVVGDKYIRFGLAAVKNVGEGAVQAIIAARKQGGSFQSLDDFCQRVDLRQVNKRVIESLILCGAFSSLGAFRSQLMAVLDECIENAQADKKDKESQLSGQVSLFDIFEEPQQQQVQQNLPSIDEYPKQELLAREKEVLGFYVSGHPLDGYEHILAKRAKTRIAELGRYRDRARVRVGGMATSCRRGTTKRGNGVIYFTLEDKGGSVDVIFFPPKNPEDISCLREDALILVDGRVSIQDDSCRIFGEGVKPLVPGHVEPDCFLYIRINSYAFITPEVLEKLRELLVQYRGVNPILFYFVEEETLIQAGRSFGVDKVPGLIYLVEELCGPGSCYYLDKDSEFLTKLLEEDREIVVSS